MSTRHGPVKPPRTVHAMSSSERPPIEPGPVQHWRIGDATVTRVGEVVLTLSSNFLLPDLTAEHLAANADWVGPYFDGMQMRLSIHTFVVVSEGRTIVVDTCAGVEPGRMLPGDPTFPDRLDVEIDGGLAAVDLVLCTHLHFDHVGWNTRIVDGVRVPTFPNARYLFAQSELDHLAGDDPDDLASSDVRPLIEAGLVDLIEPDHRLTGEVRCVPTHGHTPGHVSVEISSGGQRAVITGDATHSPIQFRYPEMAARRVDWDSERSTATRRKMIANYADNGVLVMGTHFAPPTAGHLRLGPEGAWFDGSA